MPQINNISYLLVTLLIAASLCCSQSFAATSPAVADEAPASDKDSQLQEIVNMAGAGAPGLALRMMDQAQKGLIAQPSRWVAWERQRLKIYAANQDWKGMVARLELLPATLPVEFSRWARTQKAEALLQLQQGTATRDLLRRLILSTGGGDDKVDLDWLQQWRRMIIHSYIVEGISEDALISIRRFQQDYSSDNNQIMLLRARVLLMNKQPAEVVELLAAHTKDPQAGMLYLLAQLRSEARSPIKVLQAGLRHIRGKEGDRAVQNSLWAVVAEAAQRAGDRGSAVDAIEHVIADSKPTDIHSLFEFDADSLWNAYLDYALYAGNLARLLLGQDQTWFDFAAKTAKKYPLQARAIYALLMHRGGSAEVRLQAAGLFIKSVQRRRNNSHLLQQLFTHSRFYPAITDIPEPVRRSLVDIALAKQDIPLASRLMATLTEPPKGQTEYMWHLRRARILILGGQPRQGALALAHFIKLYPNLSRARIDQFLQVVFDLQTVGEHDAAYRLFSAVIHSSKDIQLQREMYYWMADSRHAQSRYAEAAELYLKSAMLPDAKMMDPWAQAARYQAASSLAKAGLTEDANYIYQRLLKVTKEEDRRAMLRYEVQKLQLAKSEEHEGERETEPENIPSTE